MREALDQDDPSTCTRSGFTWANSLFGELIVTLATQRPHWLKS